MQDSEFQQNTFESVLHPFHPIQALGAVHCILNLASCMHLDLILKERIEIMSKIPIALQMHTLRDEAAVDFVGTLKKVVEVGYTGVETKINDSLSPTELKKLLDDMGLEWAGIHADMNDLEKEPNRFIDYSLAMDCQYVVCSSLATEKRNSEKGYREAAELLNVVGEKCQREGLQLCYHNHSFEFQTFGGKYGFDILYEESDPKLVQAQIDVYWVKHGGEDPVDYIKRYSGRCPLIHLKDMADDAERSFAEVGEGILDFEAIFEASDASGAKWYIVEQDTCKRPPLESVRISLENIKSMGMA